MQLSDDGYGCEGKSSRVYLKYRGQCELSPWPTLAQDTVKTERKQTQNMITQNLYSPR